MESFQGRVAVVSGAASGIGYAIAECLADNGARVVLADLNRDALERVESRFRERGAEVWSEQLDISDFAAVDALFARLAEKHERIDVVFANAGVSAGPGYGSAEGVIEKVSMETWRRSMDVNLDGTFMTMQAAARHMKPQGQGSIVVTASIAGLKTSPLQDMPTTRLRPR
jgi:NAD(P)-dependent dehydrogenase (short-subunit alcohol dehydrogenase family)